MATFEGTIQEFHHFIGPRIRNTIQRMTRKHRRQRNGVCENPSCPRHGKPTELHSAHRNGHDRRTIIERVLLPYAIDGRVKCNDIGDIEKKVLDAHIPIKEHFKFLCPVCHARDHISAKRPAESDNSQGNEPREVTNDEGEHARALRRIRGWSEKRPLQINHKIISAFLHLEEPDGSCKLDDLRKCCEDEFQIEKDSFNGNYAQMITENGNPHGKVFYDKDGIVFIWPTVREEINKYSWTTIE